VRVQLYFSLDWLCSLGFGFGSVLNGVIGEPIERLTELIGEPIKLTGKRALRRMQVSQGQMQNGNKRHTLEGVKNSTARA
jgi:hypothetical protein